METLIALFGSAAKIKILRVFLFNTGIAFSAKDLSVRTACKAPMILRDLNILVKADIVRKRSGAKGTTYVLNEKFPYLDPLKNLLTVASIQADESLTKRFGGAGRIKLIIAAGVFIQNWDSRVDLLIVGDDLNIVKIEATIKTIEAEIGKEIAYSAFETQDFQYRIGIHDRLVRDILDYPHVTLLDRLGVV
ncbi:MAG: hypothetical protein V4524_01050 [Patescibacteria group bacterium]